MSSRGCSSSGLVLALAAWVLLSPGLAPAEPPPPPAAPAAPGEPAKPAATATPRPPPWLADLGERPRVAIFPVQNLTGSRAPVKELTQALRATLEARGVPLAAEDEVELAEVRHRIRYAAGLDREGAKALRDEASVGAVLITSLELLSERTPPSVAIVSRLVSTADTPKILWMDQVALSGHDAPGLLKLGEVEALPPLQERALGMLTTSLLGGPSASCGRDTRFAPRLFFRSADMDDTDRWSIAILPFVDDSGRRDAGDLIALEILRQLVASRAFEVVEPGVTRRVLLDDRIILEGGVSVDAAMAVRERLGADLIVAGSVLEYADAHLRSGVPAAQFSLYVLDGRNERIIWSSSSRGQGDAGVLWFGIGRVNDTPALACRMAREAVERMAGKRATMPHSTAAKLAPKRRGFARSARANP